MSAEWVLLALGAAFTAGMFVAMPRGRDRTVYTLAALAIAALLSSAAVMGVKANRNESICETAGGFWVHHGFVLNGKRFYCATEPPKPHTTTDSASNEQGNTP